MTRSAITADQKRFIAERAHYCCEYCGSQLKFSAASFAIEHIVPRATGGADELENLAFACQGCNNQKFTSVDAPDPVTGQVVPLYHPRNQRWDQHFAWSDNFSHIIGLTPIGRATVAKLELNREGVVNLRRVLRSVGEHPPKP
jgi:5-methylcytosine-specific restriction endonuclease McrA